MKAREIKKSLIQERDNLVEERKSIVKQNEIQMAVNEGKIAQLNFMLLTFFNVDIVFDDEKEPLSGIERATKSEVDDVPF